MDASLVASSCVFKGLPSATFGFGVCYQARVQLHQCQLVSWGMVGILAYGTGTSALIVGGSVSKCSKAAVICHDSASIKARSLMASGNPVTFMVAESAAMRLFNCTSEDTTPYMIQGSGHMVRECCKPAE